MRVQGIEIGDQWEALEDGDVLTPHGRVMPAGGSAQEIRAYRDVIATAPDLLDAAMEYVANCPQRGRHDSNGAGLNACDGPMCRRFRAAIAKVEGRI